MIELMQGDCLERMKEIPDGSISTVVTSPPYWGLRSYNGIGGEPTPDLYVAAMIEVMREVARILTSDGTAWVNMGDTYAGYHGTQKKTATSATNGWANTTNEAKRASCSSYGAKANDLLLLPFRFAESVKSDTGLWLRANIPWCKPVSKPEKHSLLRPWRGTEHIFMFTKSKSKNKFHPMIPRDYVNYEVSRDRSGHPAAMPLKMAVDLILSSTNSGDPVLDPFAGGGTTGVAAKLTGRNFIGIELDDGYFKIAKDRIEDD